MPAKPTAQVAPRPKRERKGNAARRRRQILDATARSIVANGLSRTTLATVAEEAGLSQGVAVFYFETKHGLLTEVLRDQYVKYETLWKKTLAQASEDPVSQLVAIVRADFDKRICNPRTLSLWFAFWGEQSFTPNYGDIAQEFDQRRTEAISDICNRLLPGESGRAADIADLIDTLIDGYWQYMHLYAAQYDRAASLARVMRFIRDQLPEHRAALDHVAAGASG
jgi:TetR/AcrR family transcriptional repressor of bet genes